MNKQAAVAEFMRAAGQEIPDKLTMPSIHTRILRVKLILEEALELAEALGLNVFDLRHGENLKISAFGFEHSEQEPDLIKAADAIADELYVTYGTAVALGIDIDPVFAEVQDSNMSKFIDGYRREDGKWQKGPSYRPANVASILERQKIRQQQQRVLDVQMD